MFLSKISLNKYLNKINDYCLTKKKKKKKLI